MMADAETNKSIKIDNVKEITEKRTDLYEGAPIEKEICEIYSSGIVGRYIMRNFSLLGKEEVEDIVNDVFKYVLENLWKLRDVRKLKPWILKIANSYACMHKNRIKRARVNFYGENFEELLNVIHHSEDNVAEQQKNNELKQFAIELVSIFPPVCREIIGLRYKEDLLFKEIAIKLDMNYNTVRSMHARCIKLLRALLDEGGIKINDFYE